MLTQDGLGGALILMQDAERIKRLHSPLSGDGWSHTSLEPPGLYNTDCLTIKSYIFPLRSSDTCMCSYACTPLHNFKKNLLKFLHSDMFSFNAPFQIPET